MPRLTKNSKMYDDEDIIEDDDEENQFEEDDSPKKPTLKKRPQSIIKKQNPEKDKQPRYSAFKVPESMGIVDVETNEVVASGEIAILQALADIIQRLENIERQIGEIVEG